MKRRPLLFWVLLSAFAVGSAWWTVHVPYAPHRLYGAIPAGATMLSAHHNPAGRWDTLARNPLVLGVAEALGVDTVAWEELGRDKGSRALLDMLASDEVVFAYVPEMRHTGEPAWVFASWLGGESQRLRWMLGGLQSPDLRRAASRNGWPVWVWTPRGVRSDERITFALVEGLLIGCIAPETLGIEEIIGCYDGHAVSLADRPGPELAPAAEFADRGWFRVQGPGRRAPEPLTYALALSTGGLRGKVLAPFAPATTGPASGPGGADDLAGLVGDLPLACAVMDRSLSRVWLDRVFTNALSREVSDLLHGDAPGTVTLGVLGGPYSGRFMAVRLPTLVAGVTLNDPDRAVAGMNAAFDRLNAVTKWGLVPQLVLVGTQRVYAIEGTGKSAYASLETGERIAYTALGRSLVAGSNLEILSRLLRERAGAPRPGSRLQDGVQRMRDGNALAYLWFDLAEGGKVLRLAITAWSLKLLVEDAARTQVLRERLNLAKAWIDALAPFHQLQLWVRPLGDRTEFDFTAGGVEGQAAGAP